MSEGFGKIIGPVMAIVEAVAIPVFEVLVEVISFVADGFARFAKYLGISSEKIEEASRNSSEVLKTAHEEEIKRQEENTKKQEEETAKRIQKQKEEAEKRAQIQKDAMKILDDAMLSSMDNRDRDLLERERLYQEELKTLKLAGITDLTQFEEEYQRDVAEIQERYRLEAEAKQKEIDDKKKADKELQKQKDAEDAQKLKEASIMNNEDEINLLLSKFALENETRQKSYDEELLYSNKQEN
jgi:hypothetical protein